MQYILSLFSIVLLFCNKLTLVCLPCIISSLNKEITILSPPELVTLISGVNIRTWARSDSGALQIENLHVKIRYKCV